jgi:hypothetical protein
MRLGDGLVFAPKRMMKPELAHKLCSAADTVR